MVLTLSHIEVSCFFWYYSILGWILILVYTFIIIILQPPPPFYKNKYLKFEIYFCVMTQTQSVY